MIPNFSLRSEPLHHQSGLTIVELMVSMALGLLIVLMGTTLLLSTKAAYVTQNESAELQETGRFALESITRSVHQAGYVDWDLRKLISTDSRFDPDIIGLDAHSLKATTAELDFPLTSSVNGSDTLAVRFFGTGSGPNGDGSALNCAGFGVAAPATGLSEDGRGWSIFYVAVDATGEPELRCKYKGKNSWASEAIARGVESFQVLYGIDRDDDGLPNQFLTANEVNSLDDSLTLAGANAVERMQDKKAKTFWKKVITVKVALLIRGTQNSRTDALNNQYHLFGKKYSETSGSNDQGTFIQENQLPLKIRNRMRKVVSVSIRLRNQATDSRI